MVEIAERHGMSFSEREWGDTVSFELINEGSKVFSFQIAVRSTELEGPRPSE